MRRVLLPAVLVALAAIAAACSSAAEPGWTYAPATPAPSASDGASAAPSDGASAAPSDGASAAPSDGASAAPSGDPGAGDAVAVSAVNIAFEQSELEAPADAEFTIQFENKDAGVPHNVEIKDANNQSLFTGEIFNGVETREYAVPALAAGDYTFICTVHPNMTGTLSAG